MSRSEYRNLTLGSMLAAGFTLTTSALADQLIIDVTGIDRPGGSIMAAVFDSAEAWEDNGKAVAVDKDSVYGPSARLIFPNLPAGDYAVKLYHDEDNNGKLDSNMLGIPSEGFGFSNNPNALGEPDFEEAAFIINGDTRIEINLN